MKHPKLKSITVIEHESLHTDTVLLSYDAPPSVWPFGSSNSLMMKFEAATGTGAKYVRTHFDVEPKIVKS